MGLLDYFNQGKQWLQNQPQMADPHANARALMGGQAMPYNQQPQSLIAGATPTTTTPSNAPTNITPQQTQQITYGAPVGPNMGQVNTETSEISSYDDSNGYDPTQVIARNPAINQPMVGSLLMGQAQQQQGFTAPEPAPTYTTQVDNTDYSKQGVNSAPVITADYPQMNLGTAFAPTIDPAEMIKREEAKRKLQAIFGGKL